MKSKLLATILAVVLVVSCMFTMTACGGISDWLKDKDDKTDQTQTDDTNNDTNDNDNDNDDDDDDDDTPIVYSFATDSWATIAEVSASGKAHLTYELGDEKTITMSTGEEVTFLILGFLHDELADGTGRAGITIGMKDLLETKYQFTSVVAANKWSTSLLRTETIPMLFNQLPADLKTEIKTVKKQTPMSYSYNSSETTEDKLFILSYAEIMDDNMYYPAGTQYAYWRNVKDGKVSADRIKYLGGGETASDWHVRMCTDMSFGIQFIGNTGGNSSSSSNGMTGQKGISFAFCI